MTDRPTMAAVMMGLNRDSTEQNQGDRSKQRFHEKSPRVCGLKLETKGDFEGN
jgi:hypothetical protein